MRVLFGLFLAVQLMLSSSFVFAQEQTKTLWDKVVVIGTKTETTLLDSHQAISALSFEDIEEDFSQDIADALRKIPGVNIDGGPRSIGETINIRGLGDARVQVRIDGARQNFLTGHKGRLFIDPDNLKQVEVLRGNGSALYGSDALGGVINLTTKNASDLLSEGKTFGIKAGVDYNSVNEEYRKKGSIFGNPVDEFEYLVNFTHWESGDTIELGDGTDLENAGRKGYDALGKFTYHPTKTSDITISYDVFDDDARTPANPATSIASDNPLVDRETKRESINLGYENKSNQGFFGEFKSNIYYQTTEVSENRLTGSLRVQDRQTDTFGFELQNTNSFETGSIPHALTYGIEYYKDETESSERTTTGTTAIGSFPAGDFTSYAVFLQDEISLLDDRLTLIPGLRWDSYKSETNGQADNEDDQFSPKIGAVYNVTDDVSVFANYGKGFRAPRLLELYQNGTHFFIPPFTTNSFVPNPNLVSEESDNFDFGVRGNWNGFDFESVYYQIDAEDFIESSVNFFTNTTTIDNVEEAEIWGIENYLGYDFGNGFSTYATLAYAEGNNVTDNTALRGIMPLNGTWGVKYYNEDHALMTNIEATWADEQKDVDTDPADPEEETGGYVVWDFKVSKKIPSFFGETKLYLGVENIGDKAYREHLSGFTSPGRNYIVGLSHTTEW